MESLRHILDDLVNLGIVEVEIDNRDPAHAARYRVSEEALQQLKVQNVSRMPRRARRRRKEELTIEGAA